MINDHETQTRNFHGFKQYLVPVKAGNKQIYRWVFCVLYFDMDLTMAFVHKSDGSDHLSPLDTKNRISIMGKKYGPKFWKSYF